MRLTPLEIEAIHTTARKYFGQEVKVFLFGSRVDDDKRGGDIDLCIRNKKEELLKLDAKIHFLLELKKQIGEQRIDVVFDNAATRSKSVFYHSIVQHGIELNG